MKIIINNGDMFEGTLEQFEDCFFPNANLESIRIWCEDNKFELEIVED